MSDFIRREDLVKELNAQFAVGDITREIANDILNHIPFAEPERKTGRWVLWNGPWSEYVKCTACGEMYDQNDLYIGGNDYPKFCPNCGADMRGE